MLFFLPPNQQLSRLFAKVQDLENGPETRG